MTRFLSRRGAIAVLLIAVLVVAAVSTVVLTANSAHRVTAYFPQTVGVFPGDDVRMLGVPVGQVEQVAPDGDRVRVELSYDADQRLSPEATAAVIAPTLVSVRYVQLGPVVTDGPQLGDGGVIPLERTAAPVEWDAIKTQLDRLAETLGPQGANKQGSLSRLVDTTANNLDGQGKAINQSIDGLSRAFTTLNAGGDDLFGTVRNLQVFTEALRQSDDQVDQFNHRLADVSGVLDSSSQDLATLLDTIDRASGTIERFVRDHRDQVTDSVGSLDAVAANLAHSRQALADVLQRTPIALSNLHNIYDPFSGGITASLANSNFNDPGQFACGAGFGAIPGGPDNPEAIKFCQSALDPLLDAFRMPTLPVQTTPLQREDPARPTEQGPVGSVPGPPGGGLADLLLPGGPR